jgi:hypothetical protein
MQKVIKMRKVRKYSQKTSEEMKGKTFDCYSYSSFETEPFNEPVAAFISFGVRSCALRAIFP